MKIKKLLTFLPVLVLAGCAGPKAITAEEAVAKAQEIVAAQETVTVPAAYDATRVQTQKIVDGDTTNVANIIFREILVGTHYYLEQDYTVNDAPYNSWAVEIFQEEDNLVVVHHGALGYMKLPLQGQTVTSAMLIGTLGQLIEGFAPLSVADITDPDEFLANLAEGQVYPNATFKSAGEGSLVYSWEVENQTIEDATYNLSEEIVWEDNIMVKDQYYEETTDGTYAYGLNWTLNTKPKALSIPDYSAYTDLSA